MFRKLLVAATLVIAAGAATPAPAIEYLCSCKLCAARPNLGCRDGGIGYTACSTYYANNC